MVSQGMNEVLHDKNLALLTKKQLSLHERLSVECNKPRYQTPCSFSQKWVCKKREDGSLKINRCKNTIKGPKRKLSNCLCNPGEIFGWKSVRLDQQERKSQRMFVKQNIKLKSLKKLNPKFLKTFPSALARQARSIPQTHEGTAMLDDIAHEEDKEVDYLVEDIAEEIRDLHSLGNFSNPTACNLSRNNEVCQREEMEQPSTWLASRSTIKHQIQQLRAQLNELKQIRKYLRMKRPAKEKQGTRRHMKSGGSLPVVDPEAEVCLCDWKKEKELKKQHLKEERAERRREKKLERLMRKERKRMKTLKKIKRKSKKHDHCKTDVKMNCFR